MLLIVYKSCKCKDFVVYLSIILFRKSITDSINVEAAIEMHHSMVVFARDML